jgi:hypothetical protein
VGFLTSIGSRYPGKSILPNACDGSLRSRFGIEPFFVYRYQLYYDEMA